MSEENNNKAEVEVEDTYSSQKVLDIWFQLWTSEDVKKDASAEKWKREVFVKMIVEETGRDEDGVKSGMSTSFRYARNELIKAMATREYNALEKPEWADAFNRVEVILNEKMGLTGLKIKHSVNDKGAVKVGTVSGWDLPPIAKKQAKPKTDWIGSYAGYFDM